MQKLTDNIQANAEIDAINEIIDHLNTRDLGQIIPSTIPLTDAGLHLLDGALIQGSGIYSAFVDYIADLYDSGDYTAIFETEANWQTAATTYGVCGKFVYDSVNNTVRLPKYSNKIYTKNITSTAPVKGNGNNLGFTINNTDVMLRGVTTEYTRFTVSASSNGGVVGISQLSTDPTKSGIITDLSNITTSLDGYYYIVIATTTKTDIEVDIDEIATDLNGKADIDLSNVPTSKGILVESYKSGASWYRIYSDGWCEQGSFLLLSVQIIKSVKLHFLSHLRIQIIILTLDMFQHLGLMQLLVL